MADSDERVSKCISQKVGEEGWDQDQAVAACLDMERRGQLTESGEYKGDSSNLRIDAQDAPRMQRTEDGFLIGEAKIARIGVQEYQDGNGGIRPTAR